MPSMQADRTAPQRSSAIFENFHTNRAFTTKIEIHTRIEPRPRSIREPKPKPDITTALSSTGWLATASHTNVRLFRLEGVDRTKQIKRVVSIECKSKYGKVRAIAISEDILAVITYSHLLLYEYKHFVNNTVSCVDVRQIDQYSAWTPRSVAIRQRGLAGGGHNADAWIAIGGEGTIGVKLFKYSYNTCWNAQSDRIVLTCPHNTSSVRLIGFSPDWPCTGDEVIVVGATESNKIYCWGVSEEFGRRRPEPSWTLNCDRGTNGVVSGHDTKHLIWANREQPHGCEIVSATIFVSPSRRPYLFCAINQKRGSRSIRSFTVYLDPAQRDQGTNIIGWRELPEEAIRRNALFGTVTPNGRFIVVLDENSMRLLPLQGGYKGGLTCLTQPLKWPSSLEYAAMDVSGISMLVKEELGALEIIAVDGRGRIDFRRVSVPEMPFPPNPNILSPHVSEKSADTKGQDLIKELPGTYSRALTMSLSNRSTTTRLSASTAASSVPPAIVPPQPVSLVTSTKSSWSPSSKLPVSSAAGHGVSGEGSSVIPLPQTFASVCLRGSKCSESIHSSLSAGGHSISEGEQSHSITKQRSASTEATTTNASIEAESLDGDNLDNDPQISSDDFLLNPIGYRNKFEQLKLLVFRNSALKAHDTAESLSDLSDVEILLHELQNIIEKSHESLTALQDSGFCGSFFSILVLDRFRPTVATLLPIEISEVVHLSALFKDAVPHSKEIEAEGTNAATKRDTFALLTSACHELLVKSQIIPSSSKPLVPTYLWTLAVHFIDLAILSYVGAHVDALDEIYSDSPNGPLHIPGRFGALRRTSLLHLTAENKVTVQKRQLECLGEFLRGSEVWVFQPAAMDSASERLYLSTDVNTLVDIWGPLWKIKDDINSPNVSRYDIGCGYIVPWDKDPESDPNTLANGEGAMEAFCHWISIREWNHKDFEEHQMKLQDKSFRETDRLLIGALVKDRLEVNRQCNMSRSCKLAIKQKYWNEGNLRSRGTYKSYHKKSSQSFQIQLSAMGVTSCATTMEYKLIEGLNRKDALLQRWRNGARDIKCLESWGGVEVSLCTGNARRIQLLHLLRSRSMRMYLKLIHFQWIDPEKCEAAYFEALKNRQSFQEFWTTHPEWQRNIGDAINECFVALDDTGFNERTNEFSALWVDVFEMENCETGKESGYHFAPDPEDKRVVLCRAKHNWIGLLKDSIECLTMAVVEDICLSFSNGSGMDCQSPHSDKTEKIQKRSSSGCQILQTAIVVNELLFKGDDRCQPRYYIPAPKQKITSFIAKHSHTERSSNYGTENLPSTDPAACLVEWFGDASHSWAGYWLTDTLKAGTEFYLGPNGYLEMIRGSTDGSPVFMEWRPVLNTAGKSIRAGIREILLGKTGDRHHSEYMEGIFQRSPLPCLILSGHKRNPKE